MRLFKRILWWPILASLRFPKTSVAIWVLTLCLGAFALTHLKFLVLLEDLIDENFNTYEQLKDVNQSFTDQHQIFAIISRSDEQALSKAQICDIKSWIQNIAKAPLGASKIMSSFDIKTFFQEGQQLKWNSLLGVDCSRPWMDESKKIANDFRELENSPWQTLLGKKGDIIVLFDLYPLSEATRFGTFDSTAVERIQNSFAKDMAESHTQLKIYWGGLGLYLYYLKIGYFWGIALNQVAILGLFLLFCFVFRSFRAGIVFYLTFQASLIPTMGLMAWTGKPIDSLNNALPIMILMACAEDFIFFLYYFKKFRGHLTKSLNALVLPSFLTSLTTIVGFGSLWLSEFQLAKDFGLWAGVAAFFQWLALVTLTPALLKAFPSLVPRGKFYRGFRLKKLFAYLQKIKLRPSVAISLGAVAIVPLFFLSTLNYSDSPEKIFPAAHNLRTTSIIVKEKRGWLTDVSLVYDQDLSSAQERVLLEKLVQLPHVVGTEAQSSVKSFFSRNLDPGMATLVYDNWQHSLSGRRLVDDSRDLKRSLLYLDTTDIIKLSALQKNVAAVCKGECHLAGTIVSYSELGKKVMNSFFKSMAGSALLIVLFIAYLFYIFGYRRNFKVVLTVFWGPLVVLGLFEAMQISVFFVTSISMAILIGVTGDTSIHFVTSRKHNLSSSVADLGFPSFLALVAMFVAILPLVFSYYGAMRLLATIMLAGLALSFFGDFFLFRAIFQDSLRQPRNHAKK